MKRLFCIFGWHAWERPQTLCRFCARCGKNQRGTVFGWVDQQSGDTPSK